MHCETGSKELPTSIRECIEKEPQTLIVAETRGNWTAYKKLDPQTMGVGITVCVSLVQAFCGEKGVVKTSAERGGNVSEERR